MSNSNQPEVKFPGIAPDCIRCKHFEVTWEPAFPRACKLFGIKCRNQPSMEVFLSTGQHCFAFEAKHPNSPNENPGRGILA